MLDRLSAGAVNAHDGVITYTQWLGDDGGILADLTVTRLAPDDFLVVVSDTAHGRALGLLRQAVGDAAVTVDDVTTDLGLLTVQGPASRDTLAAAAPEVDWSTEAFPFRAARRVTLAGVDVLAIRITYLGELGWELYSPADRTVEVWDAVLAAGEAHGIRPAGLRALSSLRMEKGYRDYGHDIDNTDDVYAVGLGFAVALDKPGGFTGREATLAAKERGTPHHRLVQVLLEDPEPLLFHAEPVLRDGVVVGYVRAASYGWTLGGAVGPGLRRWRRAGHARVARRRVVGGRRRRNAPRGPGLAAADVRPDQRPGDRLTASAGDGPAAGSGTMAACPVPTVDAVTSSHGRCRARARWRPSRTPGSRGTCAGSPARRRRASTGAPGCHQGIAVGTAHVVAWPAQGVGGIDERRHWHTRCWQSRHAARP